MPRHTEERMEALGWVKKERFDQLSQSWDEVMKNRIELLNALRPFVRAYRLVEGREDGCPRVHLGFEHKGIIYSIGPKVSIEEFEEADRLWAGRNADEPTAY